MIHVDWENRQGWHVLQYVQIIHGYPKSVNSLFWRILVDSAKHIGPCDLNALILSILVEYPQCTTDPEGHIDTRKTLGYPFRRNMHR